MDADAWLAHSADRVTPGTLEYYARIIRTYQTWAAGQGHSPGLPSTPVVRLYRDFLREQGRAPSTITLALTVLGAWAADSGQPLDVRAPEQQPRAPRWLTPEELARVLGRVQSMTSAHPPLMSAGVGGVIRLMAHTGLRISEACAVEATDISMRERSGELIVRHGKGDKERTVPLNLDARKLLLPWLAAPRPGPLFGVRPSTVQEAFKRLAAVTEIADLTSHTLRHTFAHQLVAAGKPLTTVAAILGHASVTTTQIYATAGQAEMQAAVDQIGE